MQDVRVRALPAVIAIVALGLAALPSGPTSAQVDARSRRATIPTPIPTPSLASIPTVAPGYRAPEVEPSSPGIIGVTQKPFVGISLQDAVGMALVKNPELAISASNVRIARYRIVQDKGNFDAQLHVEPSSNFSVTPPENLFFAGPETSGMATLASRWASGRPIPALPMGPVTSSSISIRLRRG